MARDNAPIGNTCPIIDSVIGYMESAKGEAEYIKKNPEIDSSDEAVNIIGELASAISEIENVRDANSELREWGNNEYERAESAEGERDDAIRDKEYLQDEIDELKAKIEELEAELSAVEE
jgi:chromosome segregation ATPase